MEISWHKCNYLLCYDSQVAFSTWSDGEMLLNSVLCRLDYLIQYMEVIHTEEVNLLVGSLGDNWSFKCNVHIMFT